jgi:peptide-methionine (S)-S-oxide reductase
VVFDPSKITYDRLVEVYWENIDPLAENGQFCDRGEQYRTAIFVHDDAQRRVAEESKKRVEEKLKA